MTEDGKLQGDHSDEITRLLHRALDGDKPAESELIEKIESALRDQAKRMLAKFPGSLQPTELVNDVWLKIFGAGVKPELANHKAFFAYVARAMRNMLIDHKRMKQTEKRGGRLNRKPLDDFVERVESLAAVDLITLNEALADLRRESERQFQAIELRFFGGMTREQVADLQGISLSTADQDWALARAKLRARLHGSFHSDDDQGAGT